MGVLAELGLRKDDDDDEDEDSTDSCPGHVFTPVRKFSSSFWRCSICGHTEDVTTLRRGGSGGSRVVDGASLRIRT